MMRKALVGAHSAYVTAETIILSLWNIGLGSAMLFGAYRLGSWAYYSQSGASRFWELVSVVIALWGLRKILGALPGITPSMSTGTPGQSRPARLRDLKRSGLFRPD
jgi:hypothetical protein